MAACAAMAACARAASAPRARACVRVRVRVCACVCAKPSPWLLASQTPLVFRSEACAPVRQEAGVLEHGLEVAAGHVLHHQEEELRRLRRQERAGR
eukprot:3691650-Pleurochrysis_carterae.AAC.2